MFSSLLFAGVMASAAFPAEEVEFQSIGSLAFGPDGVLFVADPVAARIHAFTTHDAGDDPDGVSIRVDSVDVAIADLLGAESQDVTIEDVAVNPVSGFAYLSVTRAQGDAASHWLFYVNDVEEVHPFEWNKAEHSSTELPNPPASAESRRGNPRTQSITDLAFSGGRLYIAGLSNEEFASKLRSVPYPFTAADAGTSVEIYHGAHGRFETEAPVRTFAFYDSDEKPYMLAAYTCTPLVRIPLEQLEPGQKVRGTTVAELGNRNRPLDMVVYERDGKDYVLMANSSRGMMKISTDRVVDMEGITDPVSGGGTAGLTYETLEDMKGVVQLDRLNQGHVLVLLANDEGSFDLATLPLP